MPDAVFKRVDLKIQVEVNGVKSGSSLKRELVSH